MGIVAVALLAPLAGATPSVAAIESGHPGDAQDATTANPPVRVVLDMDPATPGIQHSIDILPAQASIVGVSVYITDPTASRVMWGIGYVGGLDRGIAFGHTPDPLNTGTVAQLVPSPGVPANPDNQIELLSPAHDPGFVGPEVQYLEFGAPAPRPLPTGLDSPIFTVDIHLTGHEPGDVYEFFLLDRVTSWSGGDYGAFSVTGGITLEAGGDAVLDGTRTLDGVDPDTGLASPPAPFAVDYVDGARNTGGATIRVLAINNGVDTGPWARLALDPPLPQPFGERTRIGFELAVPGRARLAVFDVRGRLVRTLVEETSLTAGRHAATWDGRDEAGRRSPSGVYFVRLQAGDEARRQRVVKVE